MPPSAVRLYTAELTPWLVISLFTAKGRVAPLTGSRAPTPVALVPFSESNRPPATTWAPPPVTSSASTSVLVCLFLGSLLGSLLPAVDPTPGTGAHGSSAPAADTAARLVRLVEPTAEMLPPRYTVELVAARARTWPATLGLNPATSCPVAVS